MPRMDHSECVGAEKDLKANQEVSVNLARVSGMDKCEMDVDEHKETHNGSALLTDSMITQESECGDTSTEMETSFMQSPEPTDVDKLEALAVPEETNLEMSKVHPLIMEEQELETHSTNEKTSVKISQIQSLANTKKESDAPCVKEITSTKTHCDDITLSTVISEGSKAKAPKRDVLKLSQDAHSSHVTSNNGDTEVNEPPKKFLKNLSYHGTGRLPCPSLGDGWTIEQIVRQQGKSAGRYDTYYYSPSGAKIRSKLKLREFVNIDLTNFDYNSGKFTEPENVVVSPKTKMSLLKTKELKTINRATESDSNIPSIKQSKKLLIKLPPHKKLVAGVSSCSTTIDKKRLTKKAKKRKLSLAHVTRNVVGMDDDSAQNNPFEAFKTEALSLSTHFKDMNDYDDLIQFAWNFLSIESKTRFNGVFSHEHTVRSENCTTNCASSLSDNQLQPEHCANPDVSIEASRKHLHLTKFGMAENDTMNSEVSVNQLGSYTHSDIPLRPQNSSDLSREKNQGSIISLDNSGAIYSGISMGKSNSKLKPHKRKSRVPVYIKQRSSRNEV